MFSIKCPQCSANIHWKLRYFLIGGRHKRECPNCNSILLLSNYYLFSIIYGLLIAGLFITLVEIGFADILVSSISAIIIVLLTAPLIFKLFGRWQLQDNIVTNSAKAKKWSRIMYISLVIVVPAGIIVGFIVRAKFEYILTLKNEGFPNPEENITNIIQALQSCLITANIFLIICLISITFAIIAGIKADKAAIINKTEF